MNHLFRIDAGDTYWYVAETSAAALALFVADQYGPFPVEDYTKECPDTTVALVPDDEVFTMIDLAEDTGADEDVERVQTAAEWALESGPGLLAQSDR